MPYLDNALDLSNIFSTRIGIVWFVVGFALEKITSPFFSKKAENLATKQDVGEITHIIEEVRQKFLKEIKELDRKTSLLLEEVRANSQLRMVSADKRLEICQQAYIFWLKLYRTSPFDNRDSEKVIHECFEWWEKNCLYLSKEVDTAFYKACLAALDLPRYRDLYEKKCARVRESYVSTENAGNPESDYCKQLQKEIEKIQKEIEKKFQDIEKLGNIIRDSIKLPSLSTDELSMLIKSTPAPDEKTEDS